MGSSNPVGKLQLPRNSSHVDPQLIETEIMMRQALNYIQQNAVKRGYVDQPDGISVPGIMPGRKA